MGALLESGLVGNIGLKHLKVIKEDTISKWDKLGFLEGLKGHLKENVAQLYENQASHLINEATSDGSSGSFETVVFPIVRRVFSKLQAGYTGSGAYAKNLYDLFYEGNEAALDPPGLFDYSKGRFEIIETAAGVVKWSNGALVNADNVNDPAYIGNTRKVLLKMCGFANTGVGKMIGPDGNEYDTESFLSDLVIVKDSGLGIATTSPCTVSTGPLLFRVVTQKYGQGIVTPNYNQATAAFSSQGNGGVYNDVCDVNGCIYLEVDLSCPACPTCGSDTIDGYTGTTITGITSGGSFTTFFRRYEELEFEDKIGEVSFDLQSVTVTVTERKLRAQWSPELAQDVAAFHNIDAEAELTALLSEQVAAEIDREILRDLRKGAAWNLRWDYNGWRRLSNTTSYTQKDWNQTLITAINQLSAQIHKSTLRGGANWIVVSSEVSAIFDDLEYFHVSNASPEQDQYNMGIERVGTLAGRYQVYRDPYFPPNQVLIGHKGTSLLDTGYIYAPYVPLQLTPTMYNPFNFTPIKGIMTRYAKKMVNNRFYGRITVDGVRTFDLRELR